MDDDDDDDDVFDGSGDASDAEPKSNHVNEFYEKQQRPLKTEEPINQGSKKEAYEERRRAFQARQEYQQCEQERKKALESFKKTL